MVSETFYTQNIKQYKWRELSIKWRELNVKWRELSIKWRELSIKWQEIVKECPEPGTQRREQHVSGKMTFMNYYGSHKSSSNYMGQEYVYLPWLELESPSGRPYVPCCGRSNQHRSWILQLVYGCEYISQTTKRCQVDASRLAYNHYTPVSTLPWSLSP